MTKKYVSLEHAIRNAVRDQQYTKKPLNEDFEFEMARNELRTAIDAAKRLMTHLDGEGELEAWVQSKITKGADYLDTVADYMDSRDTKKLKEETEGIMEALGIVGGVFKGNQFTGGTPHISPGSTKAAIGVSNDRRSAKQTKSLTMHGKVAESIIDLIPTAIKGITKIAPSSSKGGQLVTTGAKGAAKAEPEVAKAASKFKEPEAPTKPLDIPELPEPKLPATIPAQPKPSKPENLPSVPKPTTKPSKQTETETKTDTKLEPKTEPETKTDAKVEPKTETKTDTKMDMKTPIVPPVDSPAGPGGNSPRKDFPIPGFGGGGNDPNYSWKSGHTNPWVIHRAPKRIQTEEVDRKDIEVVARKDEKKNRKNVGRSGESQLTRQSSIQQNRVDEEKKMAGVIKSIVKKKKEEKEGGPNPLVDFHPQLNHKLDNQS